MASDATSSAVDIFRKLADYIANIVTMIHSLKENPHQLQLCRDYLRNLQSQLEGRKQFLERFRNIDAMQQRYATASDCLRNCETELNHLLVFCERTQERIDSPMLIPVSSVIKNDLASILEQTESLRTRAASLDEALITLDTDHRTATADPSADQPGEFRRCSPMVPCPPAYAYFDFESRDEHDDPATSEGELLQAVLDTSEGSKIGAVAYGKKGVGKTFALQKIGILPEVKEKFKDGVLYLSMGAAAGPAKLISNLGHIVKATGGAKEAERIAFVEGCKFHEAINIAVDWFRGRTCLFLIDDLWVRDGIDNSTLSELARLVENGPGRIVYTTRDPQFIGDKVIPFGTLVPKSVRAREILRKAAGLDYPKEVDALCAFDGILDRCSGWQLFLSLCGGGVRDLATGRCSRNPEGAWRCFLQLPYDVRGNVAEKNKIEEQLKTIFPLCDESICEDAKEKFLSLCVLRKQQYVSKAVLKRIWKIDEEGSFQSLMDWMSRTHILRVTGEDENLFGGLHDVYLDVCQHMARTESCLQGRHISLIETYLNDFPPEEGDVSGHPRPSMAEV